MMNFHGIYMRGGYMAVECKSCNRRVALTKQDGVPIFQGNMDLVRDYADRLKCRKCGSKEIRVYAATKDQAEMFLANDPMPSNSQVI